MGAGIQPQTMSLRHGTCTCLHIILTGKCFYKGNKHWIVLPDKRMGLCRGVGNGVLRATVAYVSCVQLRHQSKEPVFSLVQIYSAS